MDDEIRRLMTKPKITANYLRRKMDKVVNVKN